MWNLFGARFDRCLAHHVQGGRTPLHDLCWNKSVTVELIQALHGIYPAAAGEKDEVRRRAAANKQENTEAWWLSYTNKGGDDKEREIAKLRARLTRFKKIADSSTADGERENARRLADQAEAKLNSLLGADEEEEEEEADE